MCTCGRPSLRWLRSSPVSISVRGMRAWPAPAGELELNRCGRSRRPTRRCGYSRPAARRWPVAAMCQVERIRSRDQRGSPMALRGGVAAEPTEPSVGHWRRRSGRSRRTPGRRTGDRAAAARRRSRRLARARRAGIASAHSPQRRTQSAERLTLYLPRALR